MKGSGKVCQFGFIGEAAHKRPDLNRMTCVRLFVDQPACGEDGIVQVWRKLDDSHKSDLSIVK
jgi:hypothetical protein